MVQPEALREPCEIVFWSDLDAVFNRFDVRLDDLAGLYDLQRYGYIVTRQPYLEPTQRWETLSDADDLSEEAYGIQIGAFFLNPKRPWVLATMSRAADACVSAGVGTSTGDGAETVVTEVTVLWPANTDHGLWHLYPEM